MRRRQRLVGNRSARHTRAVAVDEHEALATIAPAIASLDLRFVQANEDRLDEELVGVADAIPK